ncbi:MAG: efflux RND transporter permease subunit, partial [Bacteroidales bacterium]|nr:efflux RND transporter permease subunit [Bacteroidales bacterium]
MSIYKTSIQKPITTGLIFVAIMVLGLFSLSRLPIDQFPEMDPPYISVMTTYPGANASEIETNISKLLENSLNSVDGLKNIFSTSKDNLSVVTLELEWGTNTDEIMNDVRTYIDFVYDNLPEGVSRPMILKMSSSQMPIMQLGFTANESYAGLEKILDDNVVNTLNRIDGIGNIALSGAPDRYIYVDLDPNKLDAYNLSVESVGQAISANNLNLASGTVKMGKEQYQLRVESEYKESEEINNIVVTTTADGKQVFVRDLAMVRDTIKDLSLDERISIIENNQNIFGQEGARIQITKQTGANTVEICDKINKEMEKIMKTLPPDIKCSVIRDGSIEIKNAIYGLAESIFYALLFVVLVVLVFLGDWRSTIIISLTIPISLIVSFMYLLISDSSLNIVSLASLTIAIGMVVDDAIVVLENITKHVERGANPREAAIYGTNEVWVSVIATTLVIVAVFMPLTMLSGMAGVMFKELGWIVTLVVCTSTGTAITLIPMLCSKMLKPKPFFVNKDEEKAYIEKQNKKILSHKNTFGKVFDKVDLLYAKLLRTCLDHKLITILITFAIFGVSLIPFTNGSIGTDFMQQQDNGSMTIKIELQRGTRIEETLKTARRIECRIGELVPETRVISTSAGSNDDASVSALFSSTTNNKINMTVRTSKKYERERSIFDIAEVIREELKTYPEIINYSVSTSSGSGGGMNSNNVSVEVYGYDFDETNILASELKHKFQDLPSARDITISREEDRAELQINFDKEKLARHGLNSSTVAMYVRYRVNGMLAGYLKEDGEE